MNYSPTLPTAVKRKTAQVVLSVPMQTALFFGLCGLTLWTLYFSTYPAAHNAAHGLRHDTAAVACH